MALYHFHVTQIQRGKGKHVIASAAYRAGERLRDEYYGKVSNYKYKKGVVLSEIILPRHAPKEYQDRETLWNAVEAAEKHKRAQLAYSFDITLQNELSMDENIELARRFVREEFVSRGMIADLAVHLPEKRGIPNPHIHVLTTMRPLNPNGTWGCKQRREYRLNDKGERLLDEKGKYVFDAVPTVDWCKPETLEHWREAWCRMCNEAFKRKGLPVRLDHRSYSRQDIKQIPTIHEGAAARELDARGEYSERIEINRWIRKTNQQIRKTQKELQTLAEEIAALKEETREQEVQPMLVHLVSDYYQKRSENAGKFDYGVRKAKVTTTKQHAEMLNFLRSEKIETIEQLEAANLQAIDDLRHFGETINELDQKMKKLSELLRMAEIYEKTKPLADEISRIPYSKKREQANAEHASELRSYQMAKRILKDNCGGKIPRNAWKRELEALTQEKNQRLEDYQATKERYKQMTLLQKIIREEKERRRDVIDYTERRDAIE